MLDILADVGDNQDDDDDEANDPLTRTDAEAPKVSFEGTRAPRPTRGTDIEVDRPEGTVQPLGLAATGWRGGCRSAGSLISRVPSTSPPVDGAEPGRG